RASFRGDQPVRRLSGSSAGRLPAASRRRSCRRLARRDRTAWRAAGGASPDRLRAPTRGRSPQAAPQLCQAAGQTAAQSEPALLPAPADGERIRSSRGRPSRRAEVPPHGRPRPAGPVHARAATLAVQKLAQKIVLRRRTGLDDTRAPGPHFLHAIEQLLGNDRFVESADGAILAPQAADVTAIGGIEKNLA